MPVCVCTRRRCPFVCVSESLFWGVGGACQHLSPLHSALTYVTLGCAWSSIGKVEPHCLRLHMFVGWCHLLEDGAKSWQLKETRRV